MKDFSKEIINIDGVDYTLFLNRKGIVAWEKITNAFKLSTDMENKYRDILDEEAEEIEIKDGDNPFDFIDSETEDLEEDEKQLVELYTKLYWIMLYENHKLNITDVEKLWDKAVVEYGADQMVALAMQMLDDVNTNQVQKNELKKLTALRPKKN